MEPTLDPSEADLQSDSGSWDDAPPASQAPAASAPAASHRVSSEHDEDSDGSAHDEDAGGSDHGRAADVGVPFKRSGKQRTTRNFAFDSSEEQQPMAAPLPSPKQPRLAVVWSTGQMGAPQVGCLTVSCLDS